VKIITMLLRKIDVPQDEIDALVEKIDERGVSEMLAIENYSVQATRREARAEADKERLKAERERSKANKERLKADQERLKAERERSKADKERAKADKERLKAEHRLKSAIKSLLDKGNTLTEVATMMDMSEQDIKDLLPQLA